MRRLGLAVICALLVEIDAPNIRKILPVDELIKQLKSGKLTPKYVANIMPRMGLTNILDLKLSLDDELMQQVMANLPEVGDLPSVDDVIEQLISGNLSQKDVVNMTPRMPRQYLVDVLHKLLEKLLPQITEYMNSLPEAAPDADGLPSVVELLEQLMSGNLTQKDVVNMTPRMSRKYLLNVLHSLPKELSLQTNGYMHSLPAVAPDAEDLPSVDELIEQIISGNLSQKDVTKITSRMSRQYLLNVLHSLPDKLLQQINEYAHSLPEADPDEEDLPSADEQLISVNLTQKDVVNMTPRMQRQYLLKVLHSLPDELLPQINECMHSLPAVAPDAEDLPSADELVEQLISGNLTQKDVVNMTPRMPRQYLVDVLHKLPDDLLQHFREIAQADVIAATETTEKLNTTRLLLYLSLGSVLVLAAVVVVVVKKLLVRCPRHRQQSADDQPLNMQSLASGEAREVVELAEWQPTPERNDYLSRIVSVGSSTNSHLFSDDDDSLTDNDSLYRRVDTKI